MDGTNSPLKLSAKEISAAFADDTSASRFPPVLSIEEAAELIRVPVATLYDWRSRGLLNDCSRRYGKRIKFFRDRLIKQIFNEEFHE
jgi:hypothetical protein